MKDRWWTWRWDRVETTELKTTWKRVVRWRRGSLLTVYLFETGDGARQVWLYGPFNLAVGFSWGNG